MAEAPRVRWQEAGVERDARWQSARGAPPPTRVRVVDDRTSADEAYGDACQGVALLWRGDFQNARQLLAALAARADRARAGQGPHGRRGAPLAAATAFHLERQARAQRARTLSMLLVEVVDGYVVRLPRAPDLRAACTAALGAPAVGSMLVALRELQGYIGAFEWQRKGLDVPEAGGRIHPHYGVFAPVRNEYIGLVARAPLPQALASLDVAFDIGTGTGVLAAVLAARGVGRVMATDQDPRALACARENLERLGWSARVQVRQADLFPAGTAALVVCNPPWLPARPASPLEHAIYDPDSRMLAGFLRGLAAHLAPGGEGWLVMSDLAEHLGLRSRDQLLADIVANGLRVIERHDTQPTHPRARDATDALHAARAAECTSLWRLGAAIA